MVERICSNPDCSKTYHVKEDKDFSMGCCSFECWEKLNCHAPVEEHFEPMEIF